jgi:hypothetical protein
MALPPPRRDVSSVLRCGVCFRNLMLDPSRSMHTVFPDGSMRCSAPETMEKMGQESPDPYVSTHVVFDSPMRRVALERAFSTGVLPDPLALPEVQS